MVFGMLQIELNTVDRAENLTLWLFEMTHAFRAHGGIDFVDLGTHVDRAVRALWFTNVTVDTFVGYA